MDKNNKRRILPKPWRGVVANAFPEIEELSFYYWDHSIMDNFEVHIVLACPKENDDSYVTRSVRTDLFSPKSTISPTHELFKTDRKLTLQGLYQCLASYCPPYCASFSPNIQMSVGIPLHYPEAQGGGNWQILQYAKFLRSCGIPVQFYGIAKTTPQWIAQEGFTFHGGTTSLEVFKGIFDPVVIIPSILDITGVQFLPLIPNRRIVHLCQGIETFHYGRDPGELLAEKTYFDLLHSVQIGRIVNSHHIASYFRDRFSQHAWYVPNSVNEIFLNSNPGQRKPYAGGRPLEVLWIGDPRNVLKGYGTLLKALEKVQAERYLPINLTVISPNDIARNEIPMIPGVNLILHCGIDNCRMVDFYQKADLLLSTSVYEGFGMPIIEALACQTPVVMTDSEGLTGTVEDEVELLTVPVGCHDSMAKAVLRVLDDPAETQKRAIQGREIALQFSKQNQEKHLLRTFSQIFDREISVIQSDEAAPTSTSNVTPHIQVIPAVRPKGSTNPLFSILMPTFNQAHYIADSIRSVQSQSVKDWELVICDDGSTDTTSQVVAAFTAADPRIRYVRKENGGTGSALNRALKESTGEWICWLSSDDLYEPGAFEAFESGIAKNPTCKFFHGHYYMLNDLIGKKEFPDYQLASIQTPLEDQVITLLRGNHVNGITICIHRTVFDDIGYFNEGNRNGQDYEMWLRISLKYPWTFLRERVSSTRLHQAVGQVAFPEAGVYDSSAGAQLVINENSFEKFFPLLDLNKPEHAWKALLGALQLNLYPDSFIFQGMGYHPSFLERAIEWLSSAPGQAMYGKIKDQLKQIIGSLDGAPIPAEIYSAMKIIAEGGRPGFKFTPRDPYLLIHKHLQSLQNSGDMQGAEKIERYLRKVKRFQPELLRSPTSAIPAQNPGIARLFQ